MGKSKKGGWLGFPFLKEAAMSERVRSFLNKSTEQGGSRRHKSAEKSDLLSCNCSQGVNLGHVWDNAELVSFCSTS